MKTKRERAVDDEGRNSDWGVERNWGKRGVTGQPIKDPRRSEATKSRKCNTVKG